MGITSDRKSRRKRRRFGRFRRMLVHTTAADEGLKVTNNNTQMTPAASKALSDVGPCCSIVIPTTYSEAAKSDRYVNRNGQKEIHNFVLDGKTTHQSVKVPQSVISESISPNDVVDAKDIGQLSP